MSRCEAGRHDGEIFNLCDDPHYRCDSQKFIITWWTIVDPFIGTRTDGEIRFFKRSGCGVFMDRWNMHEDHLKNSWPSPFFYFYLAKRVLLSIVIYLAFLPVKLRFNYSFFMANSAPTQVQNLTDYYLKRREITRHV